MMVIELAGPPGAGKTSLLPTVQRACEAVGLRPYTVEEAARVLVGRTPAGRLAGHLPAPLRRRALWGIFALGRAVGAVRLASRRPAIAFNVARTQWRRPAEADVAARRVVHWYVRMAGAYEFLRRLGRPGEALIIEEGFVHRVVQLHASAVERPARHRIVRYVESLPPSDLLVLVRAPVGVCQERVRMRGVWQRLQHCDGDDIDRFVSNAHLAIALAADALRGGVQPMVEIDNAADLARAEITLKERLEEALSGWGSGPAVGSGSEDGVRWKAPRVRLPRMARVIDRTVAWRRPPVIAAETCAEILAHYGLTLSRPPDNIPFGRRNHNVAITTPAGRKVLRRYREMAESTSVAHEHAVLTELERCGFPAVQLQRTTTGDTVVTDDTHLYALFEFERAHNMSSYVLPTRSRARLHTTAGRTLARLHRELADFAPQTAHHLGYDPVSGARSHDLGWYLDALAELSARTPVVDPSGRRHHRELAAQSEQLASWLSQLHDRLEHAALPQVMIHGDYGVHNLLFRRDGVAVVTDFELARREWRLVDLIIVLSRISFDRGQAFLAGYREQAAIPADEWRYLSDVWQHYRLTGAIHSWHNHLIHGGEQRLATARARVAEAEWARAQVAWPWR
jgi:Ser/Thr protein kinase RdoA (MazF antagonist)